MVKHASHSVPDFCWLGHVGIVKKGVEGAYGNMASVVRTYVGHRLFGREQTLPAKNWYLEHAQARERGR